MYKIKEKITVLIIDPVMGERVREINNDIEAFHNTIDCRCIDIVERKVGDRCFDFIVDDEGLFRHNPMISALSQTGEPMLVGTLIITNSNEEGETTSLTEEDIEYLQKYVYHYKKGSILRATALTCVDY